MPAKSEIPLDKRGREIRFYQGDWERLADILVARGATPSQLIREFVHRTVRRLDTEINSKLGKVELE